MADFVTAILEEARLCSEENLIVPRTIFLGGGTPTALGESHLERLLVGLTDMFDCSGLEEFGVEANPRTVSAGKAALLRRCGVSRVSLGVQAWDEATLRTLGRDHTAQDAAETFQNLREAGIPSLNLDLMFSIPGQTIDDWQYSLSSALALKPDHISAYNLNYEEDTAFFDKLLAGEFFEEPDRDADMFFSAHDQLTAAGLEHYEVSNYALPGQQSAHNSAYWRGADYLGLGPSAVSTLRPQRWKNLPDTAGYIKSVTVGTLPRQEHETLTDDQWIVERLGLELRTAAGVDESILIGSPRRVMLALEEHGLMQRLGSRWHLTIKGMALADSIAAELIN